LTGNSAEFENDARLNREPMKRFQEWDRMRKYKNITSCNMARRLNIKASGGLVVNNPCRVYISAFLRTLPQKKEIKHF